MEQYWRIGFLILVALLASFVQGSTGFGFSILAMSLWPLILPFKTASSVTAVSALAPIVFLAVKLRKHINFKRVLYPFLSSTVTSLVGVFVMLRDTGGIMQHLLGLVLILLSVCFSRYSSRIHIPQTPANGLIAGTVSGILSGLFNLGGPPMVIYYLSAAEDKMEYNATLQCYFTLNGTVVLLSHILMGNFSPQTARYSVLAFIGMAAGTLSGYALFKKVSLQTIRRLVYGFMLFFGLYLLLHG